MMNEHADHIASGAYKNFDEYQKMTGIIEGLALAERELLDYVERVLTEQELDSLKSCKKYE